MTEPKEVACNDWRGQVGDLPTPFAELSINEWLERSKTLQEAGISLAQALIESQRFVGRLANMLDEQEVRIKELELKLAKAAESPPQSGDYAGWMMNMLGRIEALERDARSRQPIGGRR